MDREKKAPQAAENGEEREERQAKYRLGLIGNANVGKTTLYNSLTHSNEHVGNWHGVTNDITEKNFEHRGVEFCLADLPGIYSLTSFSMEEIVSRNYLLARNYDMIINIVDANNLARNLYLTMQMLEMNVNLVLAVNMIDELNSFGKSINTRHLEALLGVPVIGISARKHSDVHLLMDMVLDGLEKRDRLQLAAATAADHAENRIQYIEKLHESFGVGEERGEAFHAHHPEHLDKLHVHMMMAKHEQGGFNAHRLPYLDKLPVRAIADILRGDENLLLPPEWAAVKVLEKDRDVLGKLNLSEEEKQRIERITSHLGDSRAELAKQRYLYIDRVMVSAYSVADHMPRKHYRGDRIDAVVLNKYLAIPMFLLIMLAVFMLTFGPYMPGTLINQFFDFLIGLAKDNLAAYLTGIAAPAWVSSLVCDAVLGGAGAVLPFLPQIVMLFLALSIMEDTGYLSRVAFTLDGLLNKIGLNGRSVFSLLMGFGCSATAIMTTRSMEDRNAKIKTAFLIPYMSCTAKMPIYITICGAFFVGAQPFLIFGMYLLGIVLALAVSVVLQKTKLRSREQSFIMEMPPYRVPSAARVFSTVWTHTKSFIIRVGTVIFSVVVVNWLLSSFNWSFQYLEASRMGESILASIGKGLRYLFVPIGLGTWQLTVAIITGVMGKEAVVGTLGLLYPAGIAEGISAPLTAVTLMVFCLLYVPCIATIVTMRREIGGRWTAVSLLSQLAVAYAVTALVHWVGVLFTVSVGGGIGLLLGIAVLCYALFWFPKLFTAKGSCIGCPGGDCARCKDKSKRK